MKEIIIKSTKNIRHIVKNFHRVSKIVIFALFTPNVGSVRGIKSTKLAILRHWWMYKDHWTWYMSFYNVFRRCLHAKKTNLYPILAPFCCSRLTEGTCGVYTTFLRLFNYVIGLLTIIHLDMLKARLI